MSSVGSKLNREKRRRAATYRRGYEDGVAARNDVPTDAQPVAWLRHGEETFVQNIPFGAMWISNKDDPRAFPVFERAQQPAPFDAARDIELDGVPDALAYGKGIWRTCTGCHESNEGHPTGPYSDALKCHLGGGCFECGGIGAVWDMTDYEEMANVLALSAQVQDVACQTCNGTGKEARHQTCRDCDEIETPQLTLQEDADCCIACDAPLVEGDLVYWDVSDTGYLHADCCGPERESYVNEDGEPLKDGDPIPQPFPYKPDRAAGYIYTEGEKE